jgi:pilus assembly protein CpaF
MDGLLQRVGDRARELVLARSVPLEQALDVSLDEFSEGQPLLAEAKLREEALAVLGGFGALKPFIEDPEVEELWMNEPNVLYCHKNGHVERHEIDCDSEQMSVLIERMLRQIGRRIDRSNPFVDAPLNDGSRLHVVIPDVTRAHMSFNIRRFIEQTATLETFLATGAITELQFRVLVESLRAGETVVISGATAAGKTTFLGAIVRSLKQTERIVSVEDTFELVLSNPDSVAMQTRPPSVEGVGEIDLRRLIREALRMRPSWLVVGEVRGAEAVELLVALNSGIPALCTVHANSAELALTKLTTLPLLSGVPVPIEFVQLVLGSSIGLVAHCESRPDGSRRIAQLIRVSYENEGLRFRDVA